MSTSVPIRLAGCLRPAALATLTMVLSTACGDSGDDAPRNASYRVSNDGSQYTADFADPQGRSISKVTMSARDGMQHADFVYGNDAARRVTVDLSRVAYFATSQGITFRYGVSASADGAEPESGEVSTGEAVETRSFRIYANPNGHVIVARKDDRMAFAVASLRANSAPAAGAHGAAQAGAPAPASVRPRAGNVDPVGSTDIVGELRSAIGFPDTGSCALLKVNPGGSDAPDALPSADASQESAPRAQVNDDPSVTLGETNVAVRDFSVKNVTKKEGEPGALLSGDASELIDGLAQSLLFPGKCVLDMSVPDSAGSGSANSATDGGAPTDARACPPNQTAYGDVCAEPSATLLASTAGGGSTRCTGLLPAVASLCNYKQQLLSLAPSAFVVSAGLHPGTAVDTFGESFLARVDLGGSVPLQLAAFRVHNPLKRVVALIGNVLTALANAQDATRLNLVGKWSVGADIGIAFTIDNQGRYYITLNEANLGTGGAYILLSALWAPTSSGDMKSFLSGDGQSACINFGDGLLGSVCGIHSGRWWDAKSLADFPDAYGFSAGIGVGSPGFNVGQGYTWEVAEVARALGINLPTTLW